MSKENPSILCTDCFIDANNLYEIQRTKEEAESDQENEWEHPDFDNNIFDIFDDEEQFYSFFLHCFSFIALFFLSQKVLTLYALLAYLLFFFKVSN